MRRQHTRTGRHIFHQFTPRRGRLAAVAAAVACLIGTASAVAYYTQAGIPHLLIAAAPERAPAPGSSRRAVRLADVTDSWLQGLRDPGFWRRGGGDSGSTRSQTRSREIRQPDIRSHETRPREVPEQNRAIHKAKQPADGIIIYHSFTHRGGGATYRTMCVRLCDGYYWPISFSVTRREFARDAALCEKSCDTPAVLYVYRNPGEEPESMVDLKGQPYSKLSTAFQHRVTYDASCKCRPHPWEQPSRQRHLSYLRQNQDTQ